MSMLLCAIQRAWGFLQQMQRGDSSSETHVRPLLGAEHGSKSCRQLLCLLSFCSRLFVRARAAGSKYCKRASMDVKREGIHKKAVVSGAAFSPGLTYSCKVREPAWQAKRIGALRVEFSQPVNLEEVARINPEVKAGGRFAPKDCIALQKVAIIIPFRNREEHLKYWLYYLHPILQRQQLDYGVYVINQDGEEEFNRAKLLNIGFAEALKEYDYDCFVFSDVDLIPMDDRNTYKCYSQPRHLSVSMDKFGFRLPYNQYFGGVSALSKEQFTKINGFPNNYWGWGGEDDDIYNRLVFKGMGISRPDAVIGKCRMIRHSRDRKNEPNPERFDRIAHTRETMSSDGLNTLSYKVLRTDKYPLYTKITVDIGSPNS
uniref:Beta-1,4-galactosyltransferase n=1 Tax=Strix occidentalis caurina TaxID=311401 RepID=A0A8D0FMP1_STROC